MASPTNPTEQDEALCIDCLQLILDGPDPVRYAVVPSHGGGWLAWANALARRFSRMAPEPTQVFIISQPAVNDRYVQGLIGHGFAIVQASSNVYLTGESRLSQGSEAILRKLGWSPPPEGDDWDPSIPANWELPVVGHDWQGLAELVALTLADAFEFSNRASVVLETFGAQHPCRRCTWGDHSEWS